VVWIYGGAYVFSRKDNIEGLGLPFYDGSGLINESGNNVIFVTMNYRVGALGSLEGTSMEEGGLPNAGLWNQRAVFQWVQDYISLLGGDPKEVTAMGESAGAGSVLHHLVADGGKMSPLFNKAILQSPAYGIIWDRASAMEGVF
jgi:carboxylesterase type B